MTPRSALAERKRIVEEQEALLHGVGVEGADSACAIKSKPGQATESASASEPPRTVRRLHKHRPVRGASANGKPPSETTANGSAVKRTSPDVAPVIRSERQKQKRARLSHSAGSEPGASGHMPPPPSPADRGIKQEITPADGSSTRSGMKIKIRPRLASASAPGSTAPNNSPAPPPPVLPLGPPPSSARSQSSSSSARTKDKERESSRRTSRSHPSRKDAEPNAPLVFEQAEKSGTKNGISNGRPVQFAPVGVDASDQPLYTRAPLPSRHVAAQLAEEYTPLSPPHVAIRPKLAEERGISPNVNNNSAPQNFKAGQDVNGHVAVRRNSRSRDEVARKDRKGAGDIREVERQMEHPSQPERPVSEISRA